MCFSVRNTRFAGGYSDIPADPYAAQGYGQPSRDMQVQPAAADAREGYHRAAHAPSSLHFFQPIFRIVLFLVAPVALSSGCCPGR